MRYLHATLIGITCITPWVILGWHLRTCRTTAPAPDQAPAGPEGRRTDPVAATGHTEPRTTGRIWTRENFGPGHLESTGYTEAMPPADPCTGLWHPTPEDWTTNLTDAQIAEELNRRDDKGPDEPPDA